MPLKLDLLNANDTLANQAQAIAQTESLGYELVSFAKCLVGGAQSANAAVFRNCDKPPGPLTLVEVKKALPQPSQQSALNQGEAGGKTLISYATAFAQGQETNVAAYRG